MQKLIRLSCALEMNKILHLEVAIVDMYLHLRPCKKVIDFKII